MNMGLRKTLVITMFPLSWREFALSVGLLFIFVDLTATSGLNDISDYAFEHEDVLGSFLNHGEKQESQRKLQENGVSRSKLEILSRLLKFHVDHLRDKTDQVDLVFLVDASASVGLENFQSELNFVRKLLSDFTVAPEAARVAIVTFADKTSIIKHVDQISRTEGNSQKCQLLNHQLGNISYSGGGTYTRGALLEALNILKQSRSGGSKAVFLVTDGFSNGGDPRPAAALLKEAGATIFTFGIRTGNIQELHEIASEPGYTYSYLLDSFPEFEALARRALHQDLKAGEYVPVTFPGDCDSLCSEESRDAGWKGCCDESASCACGTATGHYACLCPPGYFGSGLRSSCQLCPNGTYGLGNVPGDSSSACIPCPDKNHITINVPAASPEACICAPGFTTNADKCEGITCPKLTVPENGYLVKASACNNVVNAACGVRCKIGFHLTGDSIRLCRGNGEWSGVEPECLLKTCPALDVPAHGRIRCEHEDDEQHITLGLTAYPIDTRCQFKCDTGYQLRGSKVRNCLPLSRWDGLKVNCKPIKCQPLGRVANGDITPAICTGMKKVAFATNCTITCRKGFTLLGPENRYCAGRTGTWSRRHSTSDCVDNSPPIITCPRNMVLETLPGKGYALVNWTTVEAVDNSKIAPIVWIKPLIELPWKAAAGVHTITYVAQDASKNKAECKFLVTVIDKEPPTVENCVDPPIFLSESHAGAENVTWDEPVFYDNSGNHVQVTKSHNPGKGFFRLGLTQITYNATDIYNNTRTCILNITVEDACQASPTPSHGHSECSTKEGKGVQCVITCAEGYAYAFPQSAPEETGSNVTLTCSSDSRSWNSSEFPDCSVTQVPNMISLDGSFFLQGNTLVCNNTKVLNRLANDISNDLEDKLLNICKDDIECSLNSRLDSVCHEVSSTDVNLTRKRREMEAQKSWRNFELYSENRDLYKVEVVGIDDATGYATRRIRNVHRAKGTKKEKRNQNEDRIEVKFKIIGKIIEHNQNDPKKGILKLKEVIQSMTKSGQLNLLNNKTNQEIAKLALNLNVVFRELTELCDAGSILKKHNCVKCPVGTFHNSTREQCQSCPFGEYQDEMGSSMCKKCPDKTSTRKMHSKTLKECIPACQPGHYSHRKRHHKSKLAIEPCATCNIGFYQPEYGQLKCFSCPDNSTTLSCGSTSVDQCIQSDDIHSDVCETNPCMNGGTCILEKDGFSCECLGDFIGSTCEQMMNPCDSEPCLNEGQCIARNGTGLEASYSCSCKSGYTGQNCATYIDECSGNPCQNHGVCISTERDFTCVCEDGFEGEVCEVELDHCQFTPCREGSTCRSVNGTWHCSCQPGFLGRRCNFLPCDWQPCHLNAICVNVEEMNTSRKSYRCECPDGYTGEDCLTKVDHCESSPCLNDGTCISGLLNYTCVCPVKFTGQNCEDESSSDYVMNFRGSGTTDYAMMKGPNRDISEFTICVWLQSVDTFNYGTVLSYATRHHDNALTVTDYNGLVLYINGERVITDITANDGYWHFICITWESSYGSWKVFLDGVVKDSGILLANGTMIQGEGTIIVGQEQDRMGGGFSESESFLGKLSLLDIWDQVLSDEVIKNFSTQCEPYYGSLYSWAQIQHHIYGKIEILDGEFCKTCPLPAVPVKGNIAINKDASEITYTCDMGYLVRFGREEQLILKRKCLKQGQWEGHHVPFCTRVKCGFPGYFPRGQIHGRSYLFSDKIHYSCHEGYEFRGYPHRVCMADGTWSGLQPICIGKTCRNLLAPENGDIEYIIDEHEREDTTILQAGQQLEFRCNPGFSLVGQQILTCLDNGTWDNVVPKCFPYGCPPPKLVSNGYIVSQNLSTADQSNNRTPNSSDSGFHHDSSTFQSGYFYGDIIGFSCHQGYKFLGNHNLVAEFRTQCSSNGSWNGYIPHCIPLQCPHPEPIENAKILLISGSDTLTEIEFSEADANVIHRRENTFVSTNVEAESKIRGLLHSTLKNRDSEMWNLAKRSIERNPQKEIVQSKLDYSFVVGSQISVICDRGYQSVGPTIRTCTDNEIWTSDTLYCRKQECDMHHHPIIIFLDEKRDEIEPHDKISRVTGNNNRLMKKLSGSVGNLAFVIEGSTFGDNTIMNCHNDTRISLKDLNVDKVPENLTWTCNKDGKWELLNIGIDEQKLRMLLNEKKEDICEILSCNPPTITMNGYVVNGSANTESSLGKLGEVILFKCRHGYVLKGDEKSTCLQDGTWTPIPTCEPVTCGKPRTPSNAEMKDTNVEASGYFFGNMVSYYCKTGYQLYGRANVRCLANGSWSRMHGRCSKLSCGKPRMFPGVTILGRSYLYQDQLTYICPDGIKRGLLICRSNGTWSDPSECTATNVK